MVENCLKTFYLPRLARQLVFDHHLDIHINCGIFFVFWEKLIFFVEMLANLDWSYFYYYCNCLSLVIKIGRNFQSWIDLKYQNLVGSSEFAEFPCNFTWKIEIILVYWNPNSFQIAFKSGGLSKTGAYLPGSIIKPRLLGLLRNNWIKLSCTKWIIVACYEIFGPSLWWK